MDTPDVVELCQKLIAIDSINPFRTWKDDAGQTRIDGNEASIFAYCEEFLQQAGFQTWRQDCGGGRQNLLAEKGQGTHAILLYGHVDTVEVKPGWSWEEALIPTHGQLEVDGRMQDVVFGLGANDMKGGLAVLLCAAKQVTPSNYRLKVALGCDEEFWSLGSHMLVSHSDFLDDVIGVMVPEVGESTSTPDPDATLATLGRCGRVELLIDVPGTGGHGAEPDAPNRVNAITQAATIAMAVEQASQAYPVSIPYPGLPERIKPSALVTHIEGGEGLLSVPARASLVVNRVLGPDESPQQALDSMNTLLRTLRDKGSIRPVQRTPEDTLWPTVSLRPRPTPPLQPYLCSPEQPFLHEALSALGTQTPYQIGVGVSVADENRFAAEANKPVLVLGPRGENSHAAYEWVTIESLRKLETYYVAILTHMDGTSLVQTGAKA